MDVALLKVSGLKVASEMLYEISGESGVKLKVRGTVPYSGYAGQQCSTRVSVIQNSLMSLRPFVHVGSRERPASNHDQWLDSYRAASPCSAMHNQSKVGENQTQVKLNEARKIIHPIQYFNFPHGACEYYDLA